MPPRFNVSGILTGPAGEEFFRGFATRICSKGMLVCSGDEEENGVFIVMSGRLRVFLVGEEREISMFYLNPGDIFSMHSGCLVEACERSELRMTDIRTFEQKARNYPAIAWGLVSILGVALSSCLRTIENLMFHNIKQRIARFFLDHAGTNGSVTERGIVIAGNFTIEEIANLIGSSRQTTSTAINSLIKGGFISRAGRGSYAIPDRQLLKAVAEGKAE